MTEHSTPIGLPDTVVRFSRLLTVVPDDTPPAHVRELLERYQAGSDPAVAALPSLDRAALQVRLLYLTAAASEPGAAT